jgi:hypothetical protein
MQDKQDGQKSLAHTDALSRRHDYKDDECKERTTQIFKETEPGLVMNDAIQLKMIAIERNDEELEKVIKKATLKRRKIPRNHNRRRRFQKIQRTNTDTKRNREESDRTIP